MKHLHRYVRPSCAALALLSFLFMLGSIGAMDCETVSLGQGVVQSVAGLTASILFTKLAGGFEP